MKFKAINRQDAPRFAKTRPRAVKAIETPKKDLISTVTRGKSLLARIDPKPYLVSWRLGGEKILLGVLLFSVLAGCGSLPKPENYASKDQWMKAVKEYRRQYSEHPANYSIKMKLDVAELNAAEAFYEDGMSLKGQGDLDDAIYQFK